MVVRELLVKHGTGMHQMSDKCLSDKTGNFYYKKRKLSKKRKKNEKMQNKKNKIKNEKIKVIKWPK